MEDREWWLHGALSDEPRPRPLTDAQAVALILTAFGVGFLAHYLLTVIGGW